MIELNPNLDMDELAREYARLKRGQVKNFLTMPSAERIFKCLSEETPWGIVYNNDTEVIKLPREKTANMTGEDIQRLYNEVYMRAIDQYQYIYGCYPILENYKAGKNPDLFLNRVLEFLNSEPMLNFIRKLTGIPEIIKADAQATLYQANHFLHLHMDQHSNEGWRCAYVMNFTRNWHHDWGGFLQFYDNKGNVEAAYKPAFNAINVFTVPKPHSVSYVPLFCPGARFSITGWFRDK